MFTAEATTHADTPTKPTGNLDNAQPHPLSLDRSPIAGQIWASKYRQVSFGGEPVDQTIRDTFERVAGALASAEVEAAHPWSDRFYDLLAGFRFIPAGRILAGAGTMRDVTLFNCFVSPTIEDSMSGIFRALHSASLTLQAGGGIGMDFSTIRPSGSQVRGVEADASGPVSFMHCWDAMCRTVMSAGGRRGAMMGVLRCDHPDIFKFIEAKHTPGTLTGFNVSVAVTDELMRAVAEDTSFDLKFDGVVYQTIQARDLWHEIISSTYAYAEPGVLFIDRINERSNLSHCEDLAATNPCGEQPLPPHGACLLGSMNLTRYISDPFTERVRFNKDRFKQDVALAIRMLDNTIDVSRFPHPEQEAEANAKRRLGLGLTGLASSLAMMQVRYDSDEGRALANDWAYAMKVAAYQASTDLAAEKGAYPAWREAALSSYNLLDLPPDLQTTIEDQGLRNGTLTSIAPTGTISLFADNVSSGIEPIFATSYTRKVLQKDGSKRDEEVADYAVRLYRRMRGDDAPLPDYFVTAQDISPAAHVKMQGAVQRVVDTSISKTINVPEDIAFEDFKNVYLMAYEEGCKGCTTYRPNEVRGSVLSVASDAPADPGPAATVTVPAERPDKLAGVTHKVRYASSPHAYYITINSDADGRPFELFVTSKNVEGADLMAGLTRMISAVMRRGGDLGFVVEELKAVYDPRGGQWHNGRMTPSLLAVIGGIIEESVVGRTCQGDCDCDCQGDCQGDCGCKTKTEPAPTDASLCRACGELAVVRSSGCATCTSCGSSACG